MNASHLRRVYLGLHLRADMIRENANDITVNEIRRIVERDLNLEVDELFIHKKFIKEIVLNILVHSLAKPTSIKHNFERTVCGATIYGRDVSQHSDCLTAVVGYEGIYYSVRSQKLRIFCQAYHNSNTISLGGTSTPWLPVELRHPTRKSRLLRYAKIEETNTDLSPRVKTHIDMVCGDVIGACFINSVKDNWSFCEML